MNENNYNEYGYVRETMASYTARTFFWMFLGLLLTFGLAIWGAVSGTYLNILLNVGYIHLGLLVAELVVVIVLVAKIRTIRVTTARVLFFAYSAITGFTFSSLLLTYDLAVLILTFGMTAVFFGGMAVYGYLTKTDLSRLRPILMGGLLFLILFGLLSLFLPLSWMDRGICLLGVAIFLGFTAYDTQKIKAYYDRYQGDQQMLDKVSIVAALELYLDFINLFLYLLRFFGKQKK